MVKIDKIRFRKKGAETILSPLESDVIKLLWSRGSMRVRDIYNHLKKKRKVALTSVAVILDRLYKKKIVTRRIESGRGGSHYIYSPKVSRDDFEKSIVENTVDILIDNFGPIAVTYFHERFSKKRK
jgi:predicted transcriptional regulator